MVKNLTYLLSITIFIMVSCNPTKPSGDCTSFDDPAATNYVQITYPSTGDTLTIGKSIQIQFKFEKNPVISSSFKATALLQSGLTRIDILGSTSISIPVAGQFTCAELPWTVGNEGMVIQEDQALPVTLRVFDYNNRATIYYETGIFYLKKIKAPIMLSHQTTILITGGTGAIGSVLINRLLSYDFKIRLLALPGDPLTGSYSAESVDIRYGDIADSRTLKDICAGVSVVIHMAAIILTENDEDYDRINIGGTKNILDEACRSGVSHFIHISSASVIYTKTTPYSISKRVCERLVKESGVNYTIVRPTLVYGKKGGQEFDIFLSNLKKFPVIPFIGRGDALKRPVYVEDIIDGLIALANQPVGSGNVYNFSGGEAISMIYFAKFCLFLMDTRYQMFLPIPVWLCKLSAVILKKMMKHPPLRWNMIAGVTQDANLDPTDAIRDLKFKASKVTEMLPLCFPR
ncbi:MAG TPA: NAD(P)-dependent oxidoreductase [Chitinispirillaceae bacterium]|nr:NAD(P)-dependent oxidoreductase [Chitinispirillaceae bacterium]